MYVYILLLLYFCIERILGMDVSDRKVYGGSKTTHNRKGDGLPKSSNTLMKKEKCLHLLVSCKYIMENSQL
jgi:hypothetical protein